MTITTMLSGPDPDDQVALQFAFRLAKRMNTSVRGLVALPDPTNALIYATSPYMIGVGDSAIAGVQKAQEELVNQIKSMFGRIAETHRGNNSAVFSHVHTLPLRAAAHAAPLSSGIVFPHGAGDGRHVLHETLEHILMDIRFPVIVAPSGDVPLDRILVAWDGSPQAARAVQLNQDILMSIGDVVIAQNTDDISDAHKSDAAAPEALSQWLQQRGVTCDIAHFKGGVANGLLDLARNRHCGMIVSGGYGHSRMGERLFGGATRGLLHADAAPARLMCH